MARLKESRTMKVCEQSGYNYKSTPTIMLKGQWLKECGYHYANGGKTNDNRCNSK